MIARVVLYNLRSTYNVGAIMRTADAFGVREIICVGTTPYPRIANDRRLPHEIIRAEKQIGKTALGAEQTLVVQYVAAENLIKFLEEAGEPVWLLEQGAGSEKITEVEGTEGSTTLVVGEERFGIPKEVINKVLALNPENRLVEIPMLGRKESLNVAVATGVALYAFNKTLMV
jgi:tRNA G18 (ribose-2'-O)-methylase SpoU